MRKYFHEDYLRCTELKDIYSCEKLQTLASKLAQNLKVSKKKKKGINLLPKVFRDGKNLQKSYKTLVSSIKESEDSSPAAEWIVDNFHIIEDQIREIKEDLPKGYYKSLPKISTGRYKNYPRISIIALTLLKHSDNRLDREILKNFIMAYQKVTPLNINELWALPITLRITLIEKICPHCENSIKIKEEKVKAHEFSKKLLLAASDKGDKKKLLLNLMTQEYQKHNFFSKTYLIELAKKLRDQDPEVYIILDWIDSHLQRDGMSIDQLSKEEHQQEARSQVGVGNIINSMRLISTLDWKNFFEEVSLVESILKKDPSGIYPKMNFETRNEYRNKIEYLSKRTEYSDIDIANKVVSLASKMEGLDKEKLYQSHIGYFLVDDGRNLLENECSYQPYIHQKIWTFLSRYPTIIYFFPLLFLTLLFLAPLEQALTLALLFKQN